MDSKKDTTIVRTISLSSSRYSELSKDDEDQAHGESVLARRPIDEPDDLSVLAKSKEFLAFAGGCLLTYAREAPARHKSVSRQGDFHHYVVEPWYEWFGRNKRVATSQAPGAISLQNTDKESEPTRINGGGFNYAGTYSMAAECEMLHRQCLDTLPISGAASPLIQEALESAMADFWSTACCITTPTGYQSNILALTAVLDDSWLIVMDQKSHSSIITAAYIAKAGGRKRFRHNDMHDLQRLLEENEGRYANVMVAIEGLYSLDGDLPDLAALDTLKGRYNFVLFCDEAHSFLSLGSTGRGCLEWWNDTHPDTSVPMDLIDIRTTTLSKAAGGGIGGLVCASERFASPLCARAATLRDSGESISTPTMLQVLCVLRQPRRLERNLARLRAMSTYCHQRLEHAGVFVYGESTSPILPVYAGRPTKASELSYVLRKHGVVATPFSKPAVPMWQSRVRIGMSAAFSDEQVDQLVEALIHSCTEMGLLRSTTLTGSQAPRFRFESGRADLEEERSDTLQYLHDLVQTQLNALASSSLSPGHVEPESARRQPRAVIEAGHQARAQYGFSSGSSRWILGTYPPHLEVEALLCSAMGQAAAMLYPSSASGLMSTVAALCRPIKHCSKHWLLVPRSAQQTVFDGYRAAPRNSGTSMIRYDDGLGLVSSLGSASRQIGHGYVTLMLDGRTLATMAENEFRELPQRLSGLRRQVRGMTILLDSTFTLSDSGQAGAHGCGECRPWLRVCGLAFSSSAPSTMRWVFTERTSRVTRRWWTS
ncbi:hypothetical protein LTR53_012517 [Teratosphaeriaceae sp. CCFEE 6253]|nr:hypothetical protein LTR53_012517 [Teratosphaeriaceae sp. CCFEE 6253]